MTDTNVIDAAILAVLQNDAQLRTYCPDGVFWGVAPANTTRFVVVSQFDHVDHPGLDDWDLYETVTYLVKSVLAGTSGPSKDAAARIHTLLHHTPIVLSPTYELMQIRRTRRIRDTEVDPVDKSARWQHRGGLYEVTASPVIAAPAA